MTSIKCVVWDLDDTLWRGVLLEDPAVELFPQVKAVLSALDARGILHSIASRNDPSSAIAKLEALGIAELFVAPQIGWGSKVDSIRAIASALGILSDAIAFVDDQIIERDEIAAALPEVRCFDASDLERLPSLPELSGGTITEESKNRRLMIRQDLARRQDEERYAGPKAEFLATLDLELAIGAATEADLSRAMELTERTHQLNSTGYTYGLEELQAFTRSARHHLWIVSLKDKYGDYGKIGLALVERDPKIWTIKLLLASCRVLSRGVGTMMLAWILERAYLERVRVHADFVETPRNRMMYVAYRFAGFREVNTGRGVTILEHDPERAIPEIPAWVRLS